MKILLLDGDGIGPELMQSAEKILRHFQKQFGLVVDLKHALFGGASIDTDGEPLTEDTLRLARESDAVLLSCVGGPKWDTLPRDKRPEAGLLKLRQSLQTFANVRPVRIFPELIDASTIRPEVLQGVDLVIVRELTSGIYFGKPRGFEPNADSPQRAFNTMAYTREEISRVAHVAFSLARQRRGLVTSVDKANVLEVSQLWRKTVTEISSSYPGVRLDHMYVDNCAMQLVRDPKQFDVLLTENLFGDILSDQAAMLVGSIGNLPSASLSAEHVEGMRTRGIFEPIHGSAPDLAGKDLANPIGMLLSVAMLLRHVTPDPTLGNRLASLLENGISTVLREGIRTRDLADVNTTVRRLVGTAQMTDLIMKEIR